MPEPRSLVASSSSTWKSPDELFMAISIRTARSSPGSIDTASMAAAESEWMLGRRVSNGTRERPDAMSRASATLNTPASMVNGSPRRRWPITACRASAMHDRPLGLLVDLLEQLRQAVGGEEQAERLVVGAVDRHAGVVEHAAGGDHHLRVVRAHPVGAHHGRLDPGALQQPEDPQRDVEHDPHVHPRVVGHAEPLRVHLLHVPPAAQALVGVGGGQELLQPAVPAQGSADLHLRQLHAARVAGATAGTSRTTLGVWLTEPLVDGHGRADLGPPGLGDRPLQLPLPVLHAGRRPRRGSIARRSCASRRSSASCACSPAMGVTDLRLTGGEPLVRREFPRLLGMLAAVPGLEDISLTTNGYLLERDADALVAAGLKRVNVSIDSLQRDRFFQLTRRDSLPQVLRGLEAIARHPEVRPIKVNAVALRGFTEEEALPFAEFARSTSFQVRFIEFMPLDGDHAWTQDQVLTGEEIRGIVHAVHPLEEVPREAAFDGARVPVRRRPRRARVRQPGVGAVLRGLQPHTPDRRRQAPHLPLLDPRDGPPGRASRRRVRRRGRADGARRGLAQGAEAPRGRARASASRPAR